MSIPHTLPYQNVFGAGINLEPQERVKDEEILCLFEEKQPPYPSPSPTLLYPIPTLPQQGTVFGRPFSGFPQNQTPSLFLQPQQGRIETTPLSPQGLYPPFMRSISATQAIARAHHLENSGRKSTLPFEHEPRVTGVKRSSDEKEEGQGKIPRVFLEAAEDVVDMEIANH